MRLDHHVAAIPCELLCGRLRIGVAVRVWLRRRWQRVCAYECRCRFACFA